MTFSPCHSSTWGVGFLVFGLHHQRARASCDEKIFYPFGGKIFRITQPVVHFEAYKSSITITLLYHNSISRLGPESKQWARTGKGPVVAGEVEVGVVEEAEGEGEEEGEEEEVVEAQATTPAVARVMGLSWEHAMLQEREKRARNWSIS